MKHLLASVFTCCLFSVANAQPPAGEAKPGEFYGKNVGAGKLVKASELPSKLKENDAKDMQITGKVLDVCPKKGCWVKLQVNDSTTATIKMKNYGFFVPMALIGKQIVVDGKAEIVTTSVEDLKHIAEDGKKSKAEIDAITAPKKEFKITASGIKVVK